MATELQALDTTSEKIHRKRKLKHGKGKKPSKKLKPRQGTAGKAKNPSQKMKKLFRKRAKAYDSDDDDEKDEAATPDAGHSHVGAFPDGDEVMSGNSSEEEELRDFDSKKEDLGSEDEDEGDGAPQGITKFTEGCRAFRMAFLKIMKKKLAKDPLGPILLAHKKLVAEKLAEEEAQHEGKGEAKKKKHLEGEKGHVKPANFLDTKEKFLIGVATKGVVKLFNAVNKAQNPQGLNPSRTKDAKELAKRRKQTFLSELNKSTTGALDKPLPFNSSKFGKSTDKETNDEPGWAPLRDSYMLTNSKLKDWDKMPDPAAVIDQGKVPFDGSSDED